MQLFSARRGSASLTFFSVLTEFELSAYYRDQNLTLDNSLGQNQWQLQHIHHAMSPRHVPEGHRLPVFPHGTRLRATRSLINLRPLPLIPFSTLNPKLLDPKPKTPSSSKVQALQDCCVRDTVLNHQPGMGSGVV